MLMLTPSFPKDVDKSKIAPKYFPQIISLRQAASNRLYSLCLIFDQYLFVVNNILLVRIQLNFWLYRIEWNGGKGSMKTQASWKLFTWYHTTCATCAYIFFFYFRMTAIMGDFIEHNGTFARTISDSNAKLEKHGLLFRWPVMFAVV